MEYNGFEITVCNECGNWIFVDDEKLFQNQDRFLFCKDCYENLWEILIGRKEFRKHMGACDQRID